MIAKKIAMKKSQLSSFKKLVEYLTDGQGKENRVGEISLSNYVSNDMQWALDETLSIQSNSNVTSDKTYHLIFSFAVDEEVSEQILKTIEKRFVDALGFNDHQRISIVHTDTDNLHVHIAINKVHPDKITIHEPYYDYKTLAKVCREAEVDFGLLKLRQNKERTNDMDAQAGIQSLENWIKQECRESLIEAKNWDQANTILAEHGLSIKERGNGLVFTNGKIHVKASKIDREFSKSKLEKRLGKFIQTSLSNVEVKNEYVKRPNQPIDTTKMYENYQIYQSAVKRSTEQKRKQLLKDKHSEIRDLSETYSSKFSAANFIKDTNARKLIKALLRYQKRLALQKINQKFMSLRKDAYVRPKVWADWLKQQSAYGNEDATKILASRVIQSNNIASNSNSIIVEKFNNYQKSSNINNVTKQGSIVYKNAPHIKDRGNYIKLSKLPTDKEVLQALIIAKEKYGDNLTLKGSEQFKLQVINLAANMNLDVKFKDSKNQRRLDLLIKKNEEARNVRERQHHRYNNESGNRGTGIDSSDRNHTKSGGFESRQSVRTIDARFRSTGAIRTSTKYPITSIASIKARRLQTSPKDGVSLPTLHQFTLVHEQNRGEMLLSRHVYDNSQQQRTITNSTLRWGVPVAERRLNNNFNLQQALASVGKVLVPGDRPPEFLRGKLVSLSQIKVLENSVDSASNVVESKIIQTQSTAILDSIEKYISERNDKKQKGFDIMNHRRYNSKDSGFLKFSGIRTIDDRKMALFEMNNEVLVVSISDYAAKRLMENHLGAMLEVRPNGQVVNANSKTRNR